MKIRKNMRTAVAFVLLGGSAVIASAQYDRGYGYQQQNESPDNAAHWGYQDGFNDGTMTA
jgi:hypothetical protein